MPHLFDPKDVSKLHDPERKVFQDPEKLFPLVRAYDHGDCAEIGCGSGYFTFPMAAHLDGRGICHAVDLQPKMLDLIGKEKQVKAPGSSIEMSLCSKDRLEISDGTLELVWMVNVFHELSDPLAMIREIRRTLTPSGQLFVVDWKKEETPKGPPVAERASVVSLYDQMIEAGFTRIRSHDLYPWHYVVEALKD